jgi:nitrogen fixation-related uncharacterized protein
VEALKVAVALLLSCLIILGFNYYLLQDTYEDLERKYEELLREYEEIEAKNSELMSRLSSLEAENAWLRSNLTSTESYYNAIIDMYETWLKGNFSIIPILVERITYLTTKLSEYGNIVGSPGGISYLEDLTQQERNLFLEKAVNSLPFTLNYSEYVAIYGVPLGIHVYVSFTTYYQPDPISVKEYWKLPNETLKDLGGDCEDLSLLAYSILIRNGLNDTYLVAWLGNSTGHVAVLTRYMGRWYLIDLAGNWYNGLKLYVSMKILKNGVTYDLKLPPLSIHPEVKDWLVRENYATIDVSPVPGGRELSGIDLKTLLQEWVAYWVGLGENPVEYRLIGFNVYFKTASITQLAYYAERISK